MARLLSTWAAVTVAVMAAAGAPAAAAKQPVVKRTVGSGSAPIPRSFAGFSIEYWSATDYFGAPGSPNARFIQLLRTLGKGGVGTPSIHLGGNSADETWWNPDGKPRPAGVLIDATPDYLSTFAPVAAQSGAQFFLGGNLAIADPANAVNFLQGAVAALPAGAIGAYEIGNEPDLYDRATTFQVGGKTITRIQHRPPGYEIPQYLADLDSYIAPLNAARGPGWPPLAVGGFARHAWQVRAGTVLDHVPNQNVGYFQAHAYPLNRCRYPNPPAARWRRQLLAGPGTLPVARMTRLVRDVRARGAATRLSELNSSTCGGAPGVSDSFAAALWSADVLFGMAQAGVAGVNLHSWSGAWYSPIDFSGGQTRVRPLLYGMLFFDRAVQNGARLLNVKQRRSDPVKVWATRDASRVVRVAVINKDPWHVRVVQLKLPRGLGAGRVERLCARTLASQSGVTLGGQSFESGGFDGRLHGAAKSTHAKARGRSYTLRLPAASAALLTARPR
jgi:Glycosyl hydrolase family 79 C-terminal beta domain